MEWNFTPGMFIGGTTFEWDCDTDLGGGTTGSAMEGMVITITFSDLSTVSGELAVDVATVNRSFLNF